MLNRFGALGQQGAIAKIPPIAKLGRQSIRHHSGHIALLYQKRISIKISKDLVLKIFSLKNSMGSDRIALRGAMT
ncbi:MAG: hypothetical protein HC790_05375 [Acaryochloridaceae cyanobacterium CSU_3_4]|nr:hypothetical protein [Acaryochloridaceae cyanobacterium CSU_3_4]